MVAGKRLALEYDLVLSIDVWSIEGRHEQVEVGCQRLHHCHLGLGGANDRGNELRCSLVCIEPSRERRRLERLEVALDSLGSPSREVLVDACLGPLGLEAQGVPAEVDALVICATIRPI